MTTPQVSVVLPFCNAERTLVRAIESIIQQTYIHWELILIDNLSTDGSSQIANHYTLQDARIRLIQEKQPGVTFAFNAGLAFAKGKYIARMDADDYSHPHRLEQQVHHLENHPNVDAISGVVAYQANNPQVGMQHYVDWTNTLTTPDQIANNRFVELPTINPTLVFRHRSLEKYGSYQNGHFPEDYELVLRWLQQGATFSKISNTVLDWHDSPDRLTRTDSRYSTDAFYQVKTKHLAEWLCQNNPFYPAVVIWGGGRKTRQRVKLLEECGITVTAYIDIIPNKVQEKPCIYFKDVAPPGQYFILSYVGNRGKREEIRQFLAGRGYQEAVHFLLIA
ncbi:glycosyltransferase family 2 protein [Tunicatimonas pelagia]|uniref:glycosyltransferase family 2 protein n=1 Tax=Tunicatimonas pelagia TaxID=931531 RepID=UPI002665DDFF|nr:glycosyltransferase family 2 protein [Tunicatimonas pelagia]WKN42671.1 glycosyltransferase [Tunicatimonas pelagia]